MAAGSGGFAERLLAELVETRGAGRDRGFEDQHALPGGEGAFRLAADRGDAGQRVPGGFVAAVAVDRFAEIGDRAVEIAGMDARDRALAPQEDAVGLEDERAVEIGDGVVGMAGLERAMRRVEQDGGGRSERRGFE